jgi:hypothetical protein
LGKEEWEWPPRIVNGGGTQGTRVAHKVPEVVRGSGCCSCEWVWAPTALAVSGSRRQGWLQ